jgi:hypothetical protein
LCSKQQVLCEAQGERMGVVVVVVCIVVKDGSQETVEVTV